MIDLPTLLFMSAALTFCAVLVYSAGVDAMRKP
jgi:hypothetical protein